MLNHVSKEIYRLIRNKYLLIDMKEREIEEKDMEQVHKLINCTLNYTL